MFKHHVHAEPDKADDDGDRGQLGESGQRRRPASLCGSAGFRIGRGFGALAGFVVRFLVVVLVVVVLVVVVVVLVVVTFVGCIECCGFRIGIGGRGGRVAVILDGFSHSLRFAAQPRGAGARTRGLRNRFGRDGFCLGFFEQRSRVSCRTRRMRLRFVSLSHCR